MLHNSRRKYRKRRRSKDESSDRMKFYRNLRSFIIFNIVMAGLWITGSGLADLWWISRIWGVFLAVNYINFNGLPGTKGWLSKDWEAWMEEREKQREAGSQEAAPEEPVVLEREMDYAPRWRERDLV